MNWQRFIEERADVMAGKPVFTGTRITVEHVLTELGRGMPETVPGAAVGRNMRSPFL
jgi:uncharacterized protein (DUF433 family)